MDLYYRLNVLSLALPPLRQRKKDILPLAEFFLHAALKKANRPNIKLTPTAIELLQHFSWPGNIRELRNSMERLALVCDNTEDVADTIRDFLSDGENSGEVSVAAAETPETEDQQNMKQMKKQLALSALKKCGGNKSKAAKQLSITRYTLDRLLK